MIIWHIHSENTETQLEVGPITILKGAHSYWFTLVRLIEDFFNNKDSTVNIFEDTQFINKKDWECLFIPFDAHINIDKINSKSPLKKLIEELSNEIASSPAYHELINIWEELQEEIGFTQPKLDKYDLKLKLTEFGIDHLKTFLTFQFAKEAMTPVAYKKLLINLFDNNIVEKKQLVIIELPELYADPQSFVELVNNINQLAKKGTRFIIVTQENKLNGNWNYFYDGQIIYEALIENVKRKVTNRLPFYCDEELFDKAKRYILSAVDNSYNSKELSISSKFNEALTVLIYTLGFHLRIDLKLDIQGLSNNMNNYLKNLA